MTEFRPRHRRAPEGFRLVLGAGKDARKRLELCKRLDHRGEWDVLRAVKARRVTLEEVARLVDAHGWQDYRAKLDLDRSVSAPSLRDHADRWLDTLEHTGTWKVYRRDIRRLCVPHGSTPWVEIQTHHIQDAYADVRKAVSHNTARTCLAAWGAFFRWAIKRELSEATGEKRTPLMAASPVRAAESWGSPLITRHRFLTRAEYRKLLEVAPPQMQAQYATLVLCGLRVDEFMNLPPVHVGRKAITVAPWGTWKPKGYPRIKHGVRDVPVHRTELSPLLEHYREEWAGKVTFFVNPRSGRPWRYGSLATRMKTDVEAAGMEYGQRSGGEAKPSGVTPHTCRHTLASWLAQRDVQLMKIAAILGDTEDTVRRHYAHLLPSDIDETLNGMVV